MIFIRTMPRAGTPTDNGAMESINGWAKTELFVDFDISRSQDVPRDIAKYIAFLNNERPMCCLGYATPIACRLAHEPKKAVSQTVSPE